MNSLKVNEKLLIKDNQQKIFECLLVKKDSKNVTIHYLGFAENFDEIIPLVTLPSRIVIDPSYSQWKQRLTVESNIDVFLTLINRWETLPITEIINNEDINKKKIRVGSKHGPQFDLDSEWISAAESRAGFAKCCPFPNGVQAAIEIADQCFDKPNMKNIALQIYDELANRRLLPSKKCFKLFQLFEQHKMYQGIMNLELIRYSDVKAALMLEAACEASDFENDTTIEFTTTNHQGSKEKREVNIGGITFSNIKSSTVNRNVALIERNPLVEDTSFDAKASGVNPFLKYSECFRIALKEEWNLLSESIRNGLEIVDILEAKAMKSAWLERRLLFAEAGYLMEKLAASSRLIKGVCLWRIARHYINGFGVDITDLSIRDAADHQASNLYAESAHYRLTQGHVGILMSVHRDFTTPDKILNASDPKITKCYEQLKVSISQGTHLAAYWYGKLLFDGWGVQIKGLDRKNRLSESLRLFQQCADFNFNTEQAQQEVAKINSLLQCSHATAFVPYFLLSIHGYSGILKEYVIAHFPLVIRRLIQTFAMDKFNLVNGHPLPMPPLLLQRENSSSHNKENTNNSSGIFGAIYNFVFGSSNDQEEGISKLEPNTNDDYVEASQVINELLQRVLFTQAFQQIANSNSNNETELEKEKMNNNQGNPRNNNSVQVQKQMLSMWIPQNFNREFIPEHLLAASTTPKWTVNHAKAFLDLLLSTCVFARRACEPLESFENPPFDQVLDRMRDAQIKMSTIKAKELWDQALQNAKTIYDVIPPHDRLLETQISYYNDVVQLSRNTETVGAALSACGYPPTNTKKTLESIAIVVKYAYQLAKESRETDPDILNKHFKSALAVLNEGRIRNIHSFDEMIQTLNREALTILSDSNAREYPCSLGYHNIIDAIHVNKFFVQTSQQQQTHPRSLMKERLLFLRDHPEINTQWRGGQDRSLIDIFKNFESYIVTLQGEADRQLTDKNNEMKPSIHYPAITFNDPWSFLLNINIDQELESFLAMVPQKVQETGLSESEITDAMLSEHIQDYFQQLKIDSSIFDRLNGYNNIISKIQLKKKMLFLLKAAPVVNWGNPESKALFGMQLNEGMKGRCPDGVSSFCDDFIQQMVFQRNQNAMKDLPKHISRLIIAISGFIHSLKISFLKTHLSRKKADYEGRTSGGITLNYMLLLPLGLSGSYGTVKFPGFATRGLKKADDLLSVNVTKRYVEGGRLQFDYGEVDIPPMNLSTIVNLLKNCIVKSESGLDQQGRNQLPLINQDPSIQLEPAFINTYSIDESILRLFCERDIVLSKYFQEGNLSQFSIENRFFHALPEQESDYDTKPLIVKVMKDAVYVRILELCLYAKVPPDFWVSVKKSWAL